MSETGYLILAISIILALLIVFVVSFILYKKTPVPKGCENILINEENCAACQNKECALRKEGEK
ncbi:MAG: hypothetical protein J6X03_00175 [Bacilli bacterium]|nr:hypothetical protein [Bacilli bacterium]